MRLHEILVESSEEDRAILSLADSIDKHISSLGAPEHESNYYDDDEDPDDTETDELTDIGTIGQLFNTPLSILNPVHIYIQSDYGIRLRKKKLTGSIKAPSQARVDGLWIPYSKSLILNKDNIGLPKLKSVIVHELRHALDDFKSDFEANTVGGSYSVPRKKQHRKDNYTAYLAEPAEINARFAEVLSLVTDKIERRFHKSTIDRDAALEYFAKILDHKKIAELFPEKEKSKDYKRLYKRAVDFIDKELAYQNSKLQK